LAYNTGNTSDGEVSEWNEALLKMKRLHELQTEMNRSSINPLCKHPLNNEWNYLIWFKCTCALFSEGNAKFKKEEVLEVNKIKEVIETLLEVLPPYETRGGVGNKTTNVVNKKNWKMIKGLIEDMEFKVRFYNDKHGLSTKNQENMDGRSILR